MGEFVIQHSFNSGEWAPALNARVDLQKYHQGAALLENFFVDYRGGASTRTGTRYILQCYKSATAVRLISFQASFSVSYILEFGDFYIRFYSAGAPILETATVISGVTLANPGVIHDVAHGYLTGEWIFVQNIIGTTQLNNKYFIVVFIDADHFSLTDLFGVAVNTTTYTAYVSSGTAKRVYTLPSPYAAADLDTIKFTENINTLVLCHPNYVPYVLTLVTAANWILAPILFGATITAPTGQSVASTLGAGTVNYAYVITAVDATGQESGPSAYATLASKLDLRTTPGTNTITWTAVTGARSYNVYKTQYNYGAVVPSGVSFGFIGNCSDVTFLDTNFVQPDFSLTPPVGQNPFQGAGVQSTTITNPGTYTSVVTATFDTAPSGGQTATGDVILQAIGTPTIASNADPIFFPGVVVNFTNGIRAVVATTFATPGAILTFQPLTYPGSNPGAFRGAGAPVTAVVGGTFVSSFGIGVCTANFVYGISSIPINNHGYGYTSVPAITISGGGGGAATAVLGTQSLGNPTVPCYYNQRLVLAGPVQSPQTFYMSKPGSYYNFDISDPTEPDDSISGTLVSNQLNTIKSMLPMPSGLVTFSDRAAWQINGGAGGGPIDATNASAQSQAYNGASDVAPILATFDILYVQSKGSVVRDLSYNLYANIYTGTDISVISSHLFYGFKITGWAFAEEPFKLVPTIRDDGVLLTLTFMKEQDLIAWSHSVTNGDFKSVATITEVSTLGLYSLDSIYVVVERVINGSTVKYIELFAERVFPNGARDAWCVDAGLQYSGAPAITFTGGEHLAGATVTGLADGTVITPFVMPTNGNFTLASAASKVTVGLGFVCDLQTLQLDTGEPTIQGKEKKITAVTVRVADTLGLKIGQTFDSLVPMKDLIVGNVGSATNEVVTDLVTGDAMTVIDPKWTVPGQYCIRQDQPLPASILGVIPEISVGDTK